MTMRNARLGKVCSWLAACALSLAAPTAAWAQCAMCKAAAENMDPAGIKYLNIATLLLLTPPVAMFCGFFYLAYKRRDAPPELERESTRGGPSELERDRR
ncbi:MAG: hypothetical protein QOE33_2506 [Acidobacteriota bacterium]|nr:hypothetical protein [Acidobacteriota bacterium]